MFRYGGVVLMVVIMGLALTSLPEVSAASPRIREGFYDGKCVQRVHRFFGFFSRRHLVNVEAVVSGIVRRRFHSDPTIVPALLRMQFHDCFVNGCDASILLDGENSEKTALPNLSVRGFDLIEEIKEELEGVCPGVVSCADIIAMATRDTVFLGARRNQAFWYAVQTGRRDGMTSVANNTRDMPPPFASISDSLKIFAKKKLNAVDLVYLLGGGHSVGITHCRFIQDRLSNATAPPQMNPALRSHLSAYCTDPNNEINLDQGTPNTIDKELYTQVLRLKTGIFKGDQEMATHPKTKRTVQAIVDGPDYIFGINFGRAMRKMQAIGVLTGNKGQIRATCAAIN